MQSKGAFFALLLAVPVAVLVAKPASAYTYQSAVSNGCHERIAVETIRRVRAIDRVPTLAPSDNERALIHDLPFDLQSDVRDLSGAALAMGVRDNDLHGHGPNELDSIAQVHGDPHLQREHCLRSASEDEPNGTMQALEECKQFIREKVGAALDALDQNGLPDPNKRLDFEVTLTFRGQVNVDLPAYWIEIGRAIHAIEDSFTHNYRSADHTKVRVTMNYVDYVNGNIDEHRDGPTHKSEMDECEGLDEYRARNFALAKQASFDILHLTLNGSLTTRDQKMAALEDVFHSYLDYEPGCTADNAWCGAKENDYSVGATCGMTRGRTSYAALVGAGVAALAFAQRRRRASAALLGLGLLVRPATAQAEEAPPPEIKPEEAPKGVVTQEEVKAEEKNEEHRLSHFAVYGALTGSISNPSANGQIGGRYNLSERWQVGLDAELNGWYGSVTKRFDLAALNIYGTVVFRTPLRFANFNVRSTANIGTSTLLVDLYGAPSGSTGIFLGIAPLGLEWKISSRVFLILNGISLAVPIPKLSGAPFAYSQYRETIGVEIAL